MTKSKNTSSSLWMILVTSSFLMGCTGQEGFRTTNPTQQTVQAGIDFMDTGRYRPLRTSNRAKTFSYIASEGFMIPAGNVESTILKKELQELINSYNITQSDTIIIDGLRDAKGIKTNASVNAINRLRFALRELGYQSKVTQTPIAILNPSRHNAAILIHRKIIVAPVCEIRPHPKGTRPLKRIFGCTQEVNLANMVVSPTALDGSQPISSADSTAVALGVNRYRIGEITPLASELSTSGIN